MRQIHAFLLCVLLAGFSLHAGAQTRDRLKSGERLLRNEHLTSANARYDLSFHEGDIYLSRRSDRKVLFFTDVMRKDGNFFSVKSKTFGIFLGPMPLFQSFPVASDQPDRMLLVLENNGNLALYYEEPDGRKSERWSSRTADPAGAPTDGKTYSYAEPLSSDTMLKGGMTLLPKQKLYSPDFRYAFLLREDGNLVQQVVSTGTVKWESKTAGRPVTRCAMQTDANLVVYNGNAMVWNSRTNRADGDYRLVAQNDGNVVMYDGANRKVWATETNYSGDVLQSGQTLLPGQKLTSTGGLVEMAIRPDGEVTQRFGNVTAITTGLCVKGSPATRLVLEPNGNLVLYDGTVMKWSSGSGGPVDSYQFRLTDSHEMRITNSKGEVVWRRNIGS